MGKKGSQDNDWEDVLRSAVEFQSLVPGSVLVGGTGSALHVHHRTSYDADHIVENLESKFEELLEFLETQDAWKTNRINPPKLILGNFQGVETGIRQLIRKKPLEIVTLRTQYGTIRVPSHHEMLRIKGWLIIVRNAVRDYVDFAALAQSLGYEKMKLVFKEFDIYYREIYSEDTSPLLQLVRQLSEPKPYDLSEIEIATYKGIVKPWDKWENILLECNKVAKSLMR